MFTDGFMECQKTWNLLKQNNDQLNQLDKNKRFYFERWCFDSLSQNSWHIRKHIP